MSVVTTPINEWISLEDAHELLGTAALGDDAEVQGMIDDLDAMIAAYLGRQLKNSNNVETIYRPEGSFLKLSNWPIIGAPVVVSDGVTAPDSDFESDLGLGILYYSYSGLTFTGTQPVTVVITYESGYTVLPRELQVMFRTLLTNRYTSGGTASTESAGDIKKVSLTGVAMVEFATSGSSVSYTGVDKLSGVPEELKPYIGLLDRYRSDITMGVY